MNYINIYHGCYFLFLYFLVSRPKCEGVPQKYLFLDAVLTTVTKLSTELTDQARKNCCDPLNSIYTQND